MMRLSILVVTRTAQLINRLLASLQDATNLPASEVEVLCSWNGVRTEEQAISNISPYELHLACRDPYHFARNNNALADQARGELLLIINDDVVLDPGSIEPGAQLKVLELNNNLLYRLEDLALLRKCLPNLSELNLRNNAVCEVKAYRSHIVSHLTSLRTLDGVPVDAERERMPVTEQPATGQARRLLCMHAMR